MIGRLALLALAVGSSAAAHAAAPLQRECFITMETSQERVTHVVTVDLDGPMHWQDGGAHQPITVDKLIAFVRSDNSSTEWGNENKVSGKPASLFKLDLETEHYSYTGRYSLHARDSLAPYLDSFERIPLP